MAQLYSTLWPLINKQLSVFCLYVQSNCLWCLRLRSNSIKKSDSFFKIVITKPKNFLWATQTWKSHTHANPSPQTLKSPNLQNPKGDWGWHKKSWGPPTPNGPPCLSSYYLPRSSPAFLPKGDRHHCIALIFLSHLLQI